MIKINRILKNCEFTLESRHYQKIDQYYLISIIFELSNIRIQISSTLNVKIGTIEYSLIECNCYQLTPLNLTNR